MQKAFYSFLTIMIISGLTLFFFGIAEENGSSVMGGATYEPAEKLEVVKGKFSTVLANHTNWNQMTTWLAASPPVTITYLCNAIQDEIDSINARITELQQAASDLAELKTELEGL